MIVRVSFPIPHAGPFSYRVPEGLEGRALPGCRVSAPLGRRKQTGFIVGVDDGPLDPAFKLKDIEAVLDDGPVFPAWFFAFVSRVGGDFLSSTGELLMNALPPGLKARRKELVVLTAAGREAPVKDLSPLEKKVVVLLAKAPKGYAARHISRELEGREVSSLLSRMREKGLISVEEKAAPVRRKAREVPVTAPGGEDQMSLSFDAGQAGDSLGAIETLIAEKVFGSFYLFGRRAALGKAYVSLLGKATVGEGTALLITAEAERAETLKASLDKVPGLETVLFHGRMTLREKEEAWSVISSGRAGVIVGTRSSVFLPFDGLRLIIVDDEDDDAHCQAESPSYDARRAALARARQEGLPVVFGSPCPTVEAFMEAGRTGTLISLDRGGETGAGVSIVGRPAGSGRLISPELAGAMDDVLRKGKKVALFFNRRGYASSLTCPSCGYVVRCGHCDIPFVLHRSKDGVKLVCHYCNRTERPPAVCPRCRGRLDVGKGPGIQAIEEELRSLFADRPVARFDADSASTPGRRERILADFARGRTSILLGTRLLAGRTPLDDVGLAGVMAPERMLETADYRASWNAFRDVFTMLEPFRGLPGSRLMVQTSLPAHYSVEAAAFGDYDAFYRTEIEYRRLMNYPPFVSLAEVRIYGRDLRVLAGKSRDFGRMARASADSLEVLGPVLLPPGQVKGLSGVQFVLKAAERSTIAGFLKKALPMFQGRKTVLFSHSLS